MTIIRDKKDLIAGIDPRILQPETQSLIKKGRFEVFPVLNEAGKGRTPILLVYLIDKDSKAKSSKLRDDLNAVSDIVAFSVYIPGIQNGSLAKKLQVQLVREDIDDEDIEN